MAAAAVEEKSPASPPAALTVLTRPTRLADLLVCKSEHELKLVEDTLLGERRGTALERHVAIFSDPDRETLSHAGIKAAHGPLGLGTGPSVHSKATVPPLLASSQTSSQSVPSKTRNVVCCMVAV
jgi:hypothetical protein